MSRNYWPPLPWPGILFPPPPPPSPWRRPPPPPWSPPPRSSINSGAAMAGVGITVGFALFFISCICTLAREHRRQCRTNAATDATATATAIMPASTALTTLRRPHQPTTASDQSRHSEQQRRAAPAPAPEGEPRRGGRPTSGLPSFAYNRSLRHNVTGGGGGGEEAPTCSVCLGAFQVGETVRLLPVCLHLYHVECIDPWLDAHSTCPLCRSGIDPTTMDGGGLLPPV